MKAMHRNVRTHIYWQSMAVFYLPFVHPSCSYLTILFSGVVQRWQQSDSNTSQGTLKTQAEHLVSFTDIWSSTSTLSSNRSLHSIDIEIRDWVLNETLSVLSSLQLFRYIMATREARVADGGGRAAR